MHVMLTGTESCIVIPDWSEFFFFVAFVMINMRYQSSTAGQLMSHRAITKNFSSTMMEM